MKKIVNPIIYRSYTKLRCSVLIDMIDDRFEIFSYGELPYGITQDMIFNGYSRPINRGLFTIFMLCQIAEQSGHGIPTIVKKYGKEAFDFRGSAIKVTIKYAFDLINVPQNVTDVPVNVGVNDGVNDGVKMNNSEKEVFNEIRTNNAITTQEISKKLNKTKRTIERIIASLREKNIIKRVGSDKTGHWEIIN